MSYRDRHPAIQQEEDIVPAKGVLAFIGAVVAISAVLIVWAVWVVADKYRELRPSGAFTEQWTGPRHALSRVRQDLFDERGARPSNEVVREELRIWSWADRGRGIVRVPIDEAMDLVVRGQKP
jgi:hypothetical protein